MIITDTPIIKIVIKPRIFDVIPLVLPCNISLSLSIFGAGFGVPTDLEIGLDGMLYISSLREMYVQSSTKSNCKATNRINE
jgi:hypothetical protein